MPTYLNFLTPKILKMYDTILVTLIKMQPHNSQSRKCYPIQWHIPIRAYY